MTKIEVTQHDIDNGKRKSCTKCPVALAVNRTLRAEASVGKRTINIIYGDATFEEGISTPTSAADFIRKYDEGEEVKPFNFELELLAE